MPKIRGPTGPIQVQMGEVGFTPNQPWTTRGRQEKQRRTPLRRRRMGDPTATLQASESRWITGSNVERRVLTPPRQIEAMEDNGGTFEPSSPP
jgi:hypothetical protein